MQSGQPYAPQKNEAAKKAEDTGAEKKDVVSDYYSYLQKNYDCVKNGSVTISGAYLKECAKNPDKAKELEKNLAFFKEGYERGLKSAKANAKTIGARLVNYSESWSIDNTGNITMMASATVTSDGSTKGWRELKEEREEKLKAKKEQEQVKNTERMKKIMEERLEKQKEKEQEVFYCSKFDINI